MHKKNIVHFFDKKTSTISYIVEDISTRECAVIDPVLDLDPLSGTVSNESADLLIEYIKNNNLKVTWILETHVHADHLSGSKYIKDSIGGKTGIGEKIDDVQKYFTAFFNTWDKKHPNDQKFDQLFIDREKFNVGNLEFEVIHTPGHTPACVCYKVDDCVFVGDTIFSPDFGTARCDFPGGDARTLYKSIEKILSLPSKTRLFLCHDYMPKGRALMHETSVLQSKTQNIHVNQKISEDEFIKMREDRDKKLSMPRLIYPSVQVNIKAGELPEKEGNGISYIKIPLNQAQNL